MVDCEGEACDVRGDRVFTIRFVGCFGYHKGGKELILSRNWRLGVMLLGHFRKKQNDDLWWFFIVAPFQHQE
ncbi:hypothetical protein JTB14_031126 [Gonioctena quinquepunctata]|nr:hypothetical protein JTB14_031126 [Gonioctena quinquepunctata]